MFVVFDSTMKCTVYKDVDKQTNLGSELLGSDSHDS